ncbi:C40 family peptidase [Shouchella shacheensis]|uniref:C40 family peptidase n=1 Tax=Shouchella shacheensis TaxID=1649580 RepID=UPI00073FDA5B|nr:NlpC/P60 family protein [Shouchella shacheensis]
METARINVPAATLWTNQASPRPADQPALTSPADLDAWLNQLSYNELLALCDDNLVQSQVLFNEEVYIERIDQEWAAVIVPHQPCKKDTRGYPGWIPAAQLTKRKRPSSSHHHIVTVSTNTAWLFTEDERPWLKLSFQTELAIIETSEFGARVETPLGPGFLHARDIEYEKRPATSDQLLESARQFLGLPYLWGGMSGYGFDCSGFVYTMHRASGITIPRDASDQARTGEAIEDERLELGDLLYFAHEEGKGAVHHVGMYAGDGEMIHAPKTGTSVEQIKLASTKYEAEHCGARRFFKKPEWRVDAK